MDVDEARVAAVNQRVGSGGAWTSYPPKARTSAFSETQISVLILAGGRWPRLSSVTSRLRWGCRGRRADRQGGGGRGPRVQLWIPGGHARRRDWSCAARRGCDGGWAGVVERADPYAAGDRAQQRLGPETCLGGIPHRAKGTAHLNAGTLGTRIRADPVPVNVARVDTYPRSVITGLSRCRRRAASTSDRRSPNERPGELPAGRCRMGVHHSPTATL